MNLCDALNNYKGSVICIAVYHQLESGRPFIEYIQGKLKNCNSEKIIVEQFFPLLGYINDEDFKSSLREIPRSAEFNIIQPSNIKI